MITITSTDALQDFIAGLDQVQELAQEYGTLKSCEIEFVDSDFSSGPGRKTDTVIVAKFVDYQWVLEIRPTSKES